MLINNLLISIIIPTYNSASTLGRCLESIIEQDCNSFEVWIIDAVSTDETLQIIEKYTKKYSFINFVSEPDKGIYDAMNKGICLCSGQWLYFLGSDDTFYNKNILSAVLTKANTCDDKVIYGNVIMRGENQWNLDNVIFNGEYDLEKMVTVNICHQAIFYNKIVFQLYGNYNLSYISSADQDFNLRCYANTSFSYIDIIIANFVVGGHSTNVYDSSFNNDKGSLYFKYFRARIFESPFLSSRLYLQRAALSLNSPLNIFQRLYCLLAYTKLKIHSIVNGSLLSKNV